MRHVVIDVDKSGHAGKIAFGKASPDRAESPRLSTGQSASSTSGMSLCRATSVPEQLNRLRSRGVGTWQNRPDKFGTNADAWTCCAELFRGFAGLFTRM